MTTTPCLQNENHLFAPAKRFNGRYLIDREAFNTTYTATDNLALPIVFDTEFTTSGVDEYLKDDFHYRDPICAQIKHILHDDGAIYVHPAFKVDNPRPVRHETAQHPLIIGDYLEGYGHTVAITRPASLFEDIDEGAKYPTLRVIMYAHFAIADIGFFTIDPNYQKDIADKIAAGQISQTRRLTCGKAGIVLMPWLLALDGIEYRISLQVVDSIALHGNASYKALCANTGVEAIDKGAMDGWKTRMNEAYYEVPELFDKYALGDLKVYDALEANAKNMGTIYDGLGITGYYNDPKLSIGGTVVEMFESKIYQLLGVAPEERPATATAKETFFTPLTGCASAQHLSKEVDTTAHILGKCHGGRCKNNNPLATAITGELCDIDIGGAYASAMSGIDYPFGMPVVYALPWYQRKNRAAPLKKILAVLGGELDSGLWNMIIVAKGLSYDQDLFPSWDDYNRHTVRRTDTDDVAGVGDVNSGTVKVYTREINNGVLTPDLLEVVMQWSPVQRLDFFKKCKVIAFDFYPSSLELPLTDFIAHETPTKFASRATVLQHFVSVNQESHHWTRVNLGEFFTDVLSAKRSQHPKKTPLNTMFKLLANTAYGCQVSRYFVSSNVIVGNLITAKVRAMMWYSEKALNLFGSVTDGQGFNLNNVLYRTRDKYLNTTHLARLYAIPPWKLKDNDIACFGKLKYSEKTEEGVNRAALEHVQRIWPNSNLLNGEHKRLRRLKHDDPNNHGQVEYEEGKGVFTFEMKCFMELMVFRGSSDYSFDPSDPDVTKARSYESKRQHTAFTIDVAGNPIPIDTYVTKNPAQFVLGEILINPESARRAPPFLKTAIIKPNSFANQYKSSWVNSPLQPGDNLLRLGMVGYFSLAQFTYKTHAQYTSWRKAVDALKRRYGDTLDMFFTNDDGTVNYTEMCRRVDEMIRDGVMNPTKHLDPNNHFARSVKHPIITKHYKTANALRARLREAMMLDPTPGGENEWDLIDVYEGYAR